MSSLRKFVVDLAGRLSSRNIQRLMDVSGLYRNYIRMNEATIATTRIAALTPNPRMLPVAMLSSHIPVRKILVGATFKFVKELEVRQRAMKRLFSSPIVIAAINRFSRRPEFCQFTPAETDELVLNLLNACTLVDRASDIAAEIRSDARHADLSEEELTSKIYEAQRNFYRSLGPLRLALIQCLTAIAGAAFLDFYGSDLWPVSSKSCCHNNEEGPGKRKK